jgi:hypothetical protein
MRKNTFVIGNHVEGEAIMGNQDANGGTQNLSQER